MPTLAQLQEEMDDYTMLYRVGRLCIKRIVFRHEHEIEPFMRALADHAGKELRNPESGSFFLMGVPVVVDPDLQGPSPKIEKTLA